MGMRHRFHIDGPAILLLSCIFAACAMLVMVFGARAYQGMSVRNQAVLDSRTDQSYLLAKLRHMDAGVSSPWVTDLDGNPVTEGPVLCYETLEGEQRCLTAIYAQGGEVLELYTLSGLGFRAGEGEAVLDVQSLFFQDTGKGIRVVMVSADGSLYDFYIGCPGKGGGPDGTE